MPTSIEGIVMSLLQPAINFGLSESDFWNMTVGEVGRYVDGAVWREKRKVSLDYKLADLIGMSVSRLFSDKNNYPTIEDVYPELFDEKKEEPKEVVDEKTTQSVNHFLDFALKFNEKLKQKRGEVKE